MSEEKGGGLRFNEGKVRHDLLEPFAINELAKVFTAGAKKYADHNWLKGMAWSKIMASLKRHINAFEQGEDMDPDLGTYHMANAAWNALALVSYYKYFPQGDDRIHTKVKKPRIGLDIDDVLADFIPEWCKLWDIPKPTNWYFDKDMGAKFEQMEANGTLEDFYLQLPVKVKPEDIPFTPTCYVTARGIPVSVTEEWLKLKGYPQVPVYSVGLGQSKVAALTEANIDMFVDDSYNNFVELSKANIGCYLFDAPHNQKHDVGYRRIYSLKELA